MESLIAGVDIGGSHITCALIDIGSREVLKSSWRREVVDARGDCESIIDSWVQVIRYCFASKGLSPSKVGIAMPGPFDYENGISLIRDQEKFRSLYGKDIRALLADKLDMPQHGLQFTNDAACFLEGELFNAAISTNLPAMGITLGTGFGSAWTTNGIAEDAALWCAPFRDGIAEDRFSNRGLVEQYYQLSGLTVDSAKTLSALAATDTVALKVFEDFGSELGDFLAPLIDQRKTEWLVIGGNIAKSFSLFQPSLQQKLEDFPVIIRETSLGENATLAGAASRWALISN